MDFKGLIIVSHRLHRFSQIFNSFGVFPLRFGDNCCLQQDYLCISVRSVGDQEGSGQDEQVSVQGDDLTMLNGE